MCCIGRSEILTDLPQADGFEIGMTERENEMRVLFLTKSDIFGELNAGGIKCGRRNYDLLCEKYGEENVMVMVISQEIKQSHDRVQYFCYEDHMITRYLNYLCFRDGISRRLETELVRAIDASGAELIFLDTSVLGHIIKKAKIHAKIVTFFHNIERQYTWDRVIHNSPLCIFRYIATRYNEKITIDLSDKKICLNQRDEELLKKLYGVDTDLLLPISFMDSWEAEKNVMAEPNGKILFVGSYFLPNCKGIKWFAQNVAPHIDYTVQVVGRDMEKLKTEIQNDNVEIIGGVRDLSSYYYEADAVIMPIFMGGGMKVKTAEAMMYGKTIFATSEALEGYNNIKSDYIFECNTAEDFIDKLNAYKKSGQHHTCNEEIRKVFLEKYETSNLRSRFFALLDA